jgi:glycosyltransferase involved in cell wall biosynthesis
MSEHPPRGRQRVGMAVFSYYPDDPRVRREAEALVAAGMEVLVCCLCKPGQPAVETVRGVIVHRLPVVRKRGSPVRYVIEYVGFIVLALLRLARIHRTQALDVVHIHNMPDVLVAAAIVPRLSGARVILDLHDPMPEVFMTKYGMGTEHVVIRILQMLERWSIKCAHLVLTPNGAFRDIFVRRGCPAAKVAVVMNTPDPAVFSLPGGVSAVPVARRKGEFRLMYHGTIVERHGLDTALDALIFVRTTLPGVVLHVFGEGDFVGPFLSRVRELSLESLVVYHGQVPLEVIAATIPSVDVGIIPNKRSVFTEVNLPTRIFEYLAHGKPVIVPRTRGINEYFDDSSLNFFDAGDANSLAGAIQAIQRDPVRAQVVLDRGRAIFEKHSWPVERANFVRLVEGLLAPPQPPV